MLRPVVQVHLAPPGKIESCDDFVLAFRTSGDPFTSPTPPLARHVGSGRPRALTGVLSDELARRAGESCGRSPTTDIVDGVVIQSAARRDDDVYTGDAADETHLAEHAISQVTDIPNVP